MRNRAKPAETVAEPANLIVETIEEHNDKVEPITEITERHDSYFAGFDIDLESDNE